MKAASWCLAGLVTALAAWLTKKGSALALLVAAAAGGLPFLLLK